jgi:C4-dicarboxylate-specific signal transduction histidine kinase/ABC-type nitrate/sulfonate/bicarbonate transport system substrate-binding protein
MKKLFIFLLLNLFIVSTLFSKELEKVTLQFQWLDQFQFAGYYMAKEKGFYEDVGLEVEFKKYSNHINPAKEVENKKVNYAVGRSSLIIERSKGKSIKLLASIFQSSPLVLLTTKKSKIKHIKDFVGKKIMTTSDVVEAASYQGMMKKYNVSIEDLKILKHSFNINDLISGKTDLMASYISNEPFLLKQKGIEYKIFNPKDYGFDFYSDILFTSQYEIDNYRQRTINFKNASIKGWEYAFEHIDETVEIILAKYNTQHKSREALIYEGKRLKELAYYKTKKLGVMENHKLERIYDIYNVMGFIKNPIDVDDFVFSNEQKRLHFSKKEIEYLKELKNINMCVDPNWMPFESIKDDKHIGISADYFKIFKEEISIPINLIKTKNWTQSLEFIKEKKCDILSLVMQTEERKKYINFTASYFESPLVLVTKKGVDFITNFNQLKNQKIGLPKDYALLYILRKKYPNLNIVEIDNINDGLDKVVSGDIFAYIGSSISIAYQFKTKYIDLLQISGQFNEKWELSVGVRNDDLVLLGIFEKIVANLTQAQHNKILNNWTFKVEKVKDYTLAFEILLVLIAAIFLFLYIYSKLTTYNEKLKKSNRIIKEKEYSLVLLNNTLEDKVRQATQELKKAQKIAKIASFKLKRKDKTVTCSDEIYEIFGFKKSKKSFTQKDFLDKVDNFDKNMVKQVFKNHLVDKKPYFIAYKINLNNNTSKYIEERGETLFDGDVAIETFGTLQDVTEQVLKDLEIKKKDEQLFAQSRLAQMGEMLSMIAHQWRQPLTAIGATTSSLKFSVKLDNVNTEKFENELTLIENFTDHLSETIEDFRDFFKDSKEKKLVTLESLIDRTLSIVNSSINNKSIKIVTHYNCNEEILIYSNELKQVILNIIKNAEDALLESNQENKIILIETFSTDSKKVIKISDNAGGIHQSIISNIFDPYFSTKKDKNGTGLGLYMSKIIVDKHCNGSLNVANDNGGAVFTIELSS